MLNQYTELLDTITNHVLNAINLQSTPTIFCLGEVIQVEPLRIKISANQILGEDELLLSATVRETWIDIPTTPNDTGDIEEGSEDGGTDNVFMHRHHIVAETKEASDGGQGASPHKHAIDIYTKYSLPKIRLWRGLEVGDIVRLLRVQGGQLFYVIEREEKITNEGAI